MTLMLVVIAGCGGGADHWDPNNVTVTVSPASANVAPSGTLDVQATINNLCKTCAPDALFVIGEMETDGASGSQCNWSTGDPQPVGPCPDGTIEVGIGASTKATFHAPNTTGTVHVIAEWFAQDPKTNQTIIKSATATITVQ
jgi:hypothetical protein